MDGIRTFFFDNFAVIFLAAAAGSAVFIAWALGLFGRRGGKDD